VAGAGTELSFLFSSFFIISHFYRLLSETRYLTVLSLNGLWISVLSVLRPAGFDG